MQRPVRCSVREVEVERLLSRSFINHLKRVVGDSIREVEVRRLGVDRRVVQHHRERVEQRPVSAQYAKEPVEATLTRRRATRRTSIPPLFRHRRMVVATHMPLAAHQRAIASRAQHFGDRGAVFVKISLVPRTAVVLHHMAHTRLVRIQARQQCSPRRTAARRIIHLCEAQPVVAHAIEVGRANLRAIATNIRESQVVNEADNDIWASVGLRGHWHTPITNSAVNFALKVCQNAPKCQCRKQIGDWHSHQSPTSNRSVLASSTLGYPLPCSAQGS